MQGRNKPKKVYYFSDRLKKQLAKMHHYPLTIVEAPSGFGKTTAVREYLKENLPPNAREYWYTCLGEPASMAWRSICELISYANDKIADNLEKLKMPTMDTLMYMMAALRDFQCASETYLVIDNYQLVSCEIPRELMNVFSMHGSPNLHLIFITQQLESRQQFTIHNDSIHTIDPTAFFFDKEGTASLFLMEGIRLSDSELNSVYSSTEGWVSAIRLQIINYEETGSFDLTADIEHLVETAVWNRLAPEEKDFLLSVSILDSFNARQAAVMIDQEVLPVHIEELLRTNDFIRYFPDRNLYTIHGILQDYLRNRFYHYQPEDFQRNMLRRAGQSHIILGHFYPAAQYFFKIGDYDAILSMPFDSEYLSNQKENFLPEFIAELVAESPEETLRKYPYALLTFSYQMYLSGQYDTYQKLCRLIASIVETNESLNPEELRRIKGEFAIIGSLGAFNNINEMNRRYRNAWEILGGPSELLKYDIPYTFGCTSVLFMFWRESGELENELMDMERTLPDYRKLTRGHGTGADSVMRAEAMLMRGEDDEAEILCHKALYEARSHQQTSICLCAEQVLARVAILRGDVEGFNTAMKNIRSYAKENSNLYVMRMVDLCLTVISLVLGIKDDVAKWVYDIENIKQTLYAPVIPYAQTLYSLVLIMDKRYNEFLGISQLILDAAKDTAGNIRYMIPLVYHLKHLALVKLSSGDVQKAQEYLNQALEIALPDKIYIPFARQDGVLDSLLEAAKNNVSDKEGLKALIAVCKRQRRGVGVIRKAIQSNKSVLTPREREVAALARERLSAKEIAEELYISEATVKTILKSVYSKLDIHSKSELHTKEF